MLLARIADCVYWTGRYTTRAAITSRLVLEHTGLRCDMPKGVDVGWEPLVAITGETPPEGVESENDVVRFLVVDTDNPNSVLASLSNARHNALRARAVFPIEAWETLNMCWGAADAASPEAYTRRRRYPYLMSVIDGCQHFVGRATIQMNRDSAFTFFDIGRELERAELTTRVLDVRAAMLDAVSLDSERPFADVQWMSVLRSLAAFHPSRRSRRGRVDGRTTLRFLLTDDSFPGSVAYCVDSIAFSLRRLDAGDDLLDSCERVRADLTHAEDYFDSADDLRLYLETIQRRLGDIHGHLAQSFFDRQTADEDEDATEDEPTVVAATADAAESKAEKASV